MMCIPCAAGYGFGCRIDITGLRGNVKVKMRRCLFGDVAEEICIWDFRFQRNWLSGMGLIGRMDEYRYCGWDG